MRKYLSNWLIIYRKIKKTKIKKGQCRKHNTIGKNSWVFAEILR